MDPSSLLASASGGKVQTMHKPAHRGILALTTIAAAALVLTACSSGDDASSSTSPAASASSSASATGGESASASSSSAPTVEGAAAAACLAYFDLDLLNSQYAGGAVDNGNLTEKQAKKQMKSQLKELVAQAQAAVADGSAGQKLVNNSERMRKIVVSLSKSQSLSDLTKAQKERFAKSSLRVQRACEAAGYPLPDDNVTARTAAGV